jgi:hypothetical protein
MSTIVVEHKQTHMSMCGHKLICLPLFAVAVLGRFVFALNEFCAKKYGMQHSVSDYWIYEFAKVIAVMTLSGFAVHLEHQ